MQTWAVVGCAALLTVGGGEPSSAQREGVKSRTISGKTQPDQIPEAIVWEVTLDDLVVFVDGKGTVERPERIEALSRYSLYIPPEEVRVALAVARETLKLAGELRGQHASAQTAGVGPTQEELAARKTAIGGVFLAGRDELARRLPPKSFRAIRRWIDSKVLPGLTIEVPDR